MKKTKKRINNNIIILFHNKKIFYFIIFLATILAILIFISIEIERDLKEKQYSSELMKSGNYKNCSKDEDCILQQISCCSCNMGGEQKCINKEEAKKIQEELKKCSKDIMCIALYNCKDIECKCIEGYCKEV
ncbi:MAG: hypothetical protein QW117_01945 [Candidatus Pacearchaeota archaeon]